MNNPLRIGIMKHRVSKKPDKLRSLSLSIVKYNINTGEKISKDRVYLLDGKVKLTDLNKFSKNKKEKLKGNEYSLEIPIKYNSSGVYGLEEDSKTMQFKSLLIKFICDKEKQEEKDLLKAVEELNKFRKKADKEYFNRFHSNRVEIMLGCISNEGKNYIKKFEMRFQGYTTIQYFGKKLNLVTY